MLTFLLSDNDFPKSNLNIPGRRPYGCLPEQQPTGGHRTGEVGKTKYFFPPDCLGHSRRGVFSCIKADGCHFLPQNAVESFNSPAKCCRDMPSGNLRRSWSEWQFAHRR